MDQASMERITERSVVNWTSNAADIETYLSAQVSDVSHRDVVGPLKAAAGASGVVRVGGAEVAVWGDPDEPEMAFSVTKSVVSAVAGLAYDDGLLVPDQPVHEVLDVDEFRGPHNERITWRHLLQQSSQWEGELWGKPTSVDVQSYREGTEVHGTSPGEGWAYNDVRMNLLTYALTLLLRESLADVLRTRVMEPLAASDRWSWHGYTTSMVELDGTTVDVVSGGAHWGGGLVIPDRDLALIGQLFLDRGMHDGARMLSADWSSSRGPRARSSPSTGISGGSTTRRCRGRGHRAPGAVRGATPDVTCSGSTPPATSSSRRTGPKTRSA